MYGHILQEKEIYVSTNNFEKDFEISRYPKVVLSCKSI